MSLVTPVATVVFFLLLPVLGNELAAVPVNVELGQRGDGLLALLGVEGTAELQLDFLDFGEFEGFGAAEGTLVGVLFDATDALEAEGLTAFAVALVGFIGDVVADGALALLRLARLPNKLFGLESFHAKSIIFYTMDPLHLIKSISLFY